MIVIRVELHSAVTRKVTELARMHICNIGGTKSRRDYSGQTFTGRDRDTLDRSVANGTVTRSGEVMNHKSEAQHVWNLVAKMLNNLGYGKLP